MNINRINYIVVHCSATNPSQDIGVKEIDQWHKQRGWAGCGYHHVIRRNGKVEKGRPHNKVGAHVKGYNRESIGVCLVCGLNNKGKADANFTKKQYKSLDNLIAELKLKFPQAKVLGHRDLDPMKACPCFCIDSWMQEWS